MSTITEMIAILIGRNMLEANIRGLPNQMLPNNKKQFYMISTITRKLQQFETIILLACNLQ